MNRKINQTAIMMHGIMTLILLMLFVAMIVFMVSPANAAEITPNPSSYTLGATSEFSSAQQSQNGVNADDSSANNLANTGQSFYVVVVMASSILLAVFVGFSFISRNKFKEKYVRYKR